MREYKTSSPLVEEAKGRQLVEQPIEIHREARRQQDSHGGPSQQRRGPSSQRSVPLRTIRKFFSKHLGMHGVFTKPTPKSPSPPLHGLPPRPVNANQSLARERPHSLSQTGLIQRPILPPLPELGNINGTRAFNRTAFNTTRGTQPRPMAPQVERPPRPIAREKPERSVPLRALRKFFAKHTGLHGVLTPSSSSRIPLTPREQRFQALPNAAQSHIRQELSKSNNNFQHPQPGTPIPNPSNPVQGSFPGRAAEEFSKQTHAGMPPQYRYPPPPKGSRIADPPPKGPSPFQSRRETPASQHKVNDKTNPFTSFHPRKDDSNPPPPGMPSRTFPTDKRTFGSAATSNEAAAGPYRIPDVLPRPPPAPLDTDKSTKEAQGRNEREN